LIDYSLTVEELETIDITIIFYVKTRQNDLEKETNVHIKLEKQRKYIP